MPKKICNYPNCKQIINYKERYCDEHKAIKEQQNKDKFKLYSSNKRDDKEQKFYNSTAWKRTKQAVEVRDNYLCVRCLNKGIIRTREVVHHIIPIKDNWNKRYDLNNLQCLCHSCHREVHHEIDRGKKG